MGTTLNQEIWTDFMVTDYLLTASVRDIFKLSNNFNRLVVEAAGVEPAASSVTH